MTLHAELSTYVTVKFFDKVTDFDVMIWRSYHQVIYFNPSHSHKQDGCRAYFLFVIGNFTEKFNTPRYKLISFTNKSENAYT
jgi:hypothetical protein